MSDADITQLQLLQQNLQNILVQKQQFQKQLAELNSALKEIETSETTYKILGNIMVAAKKDNLQKELTGKKELLDLRLKNFDKQEKTLNEKTEELQKKVMAEMKK
tara:strand:+ start:237 stop:551 length:315 start_codon:yes stop_codon:yes gene_type:complete